MGVIGEASSKGGSAPGATPPRRLRIAIVAPTLEIVGGQSIQAAWLIERLRSVPGLDVELLPVNPTLTPPFGRLQSLKYVRTLVTETWYVWTLIRSLRRYDVAHVFSASYLSFVLAPTPAILIGRLFGRKVILNYHSGEADDHLRRWKRSAIPVMRLADRIVVPSDYLVEVFARHGLTASAVPNFVQGSHATFRERDGLEPVFLANRNLEPMYDVATVIRAFARIRERFDGARLLVAGEGSERRRLEALVHELELGGVEFLGRVTPNRMGDVYNRADIYLNASLIDNMPLSILESFGAGLPVVTTSAGGIPHIARHEENALISEPGDHEALAASAIRLLEEPELAGRLVSQAHEEFQQLYTWKAVSAGWVGLYRELTAGGGPPAKTAG